MSHFNNAANTWDSEEKIAQMSELAIDIMRHLNMNRALDIMDFGCGTGLLGLEFIDHAKSITGIDPSEGMLEVFDKKAAEFNHVKSINIDLELNDLDEKYDLIVSAMAFHHLDRPDLMLVKLAKMLNQHGQIAIVDLESEDGSFHPSPKEMGVKHFGFSNEEIESWAKESGLSVAIHRIATRHKNGRDYYQFLAVFTK